MLAIRREPIRWRYSHTYGNCVDYKLGHENNTSFNRTYSFLQKKVQTKSSPRKNANKSK